MLSRTHRTLSGAVRLAVTAPFFGLGMATMVASLVVWWIFGIAVMAGLGLALVGFLGDALGFEPGLPTTLGAAILFALIGTWVMVGEAWKTVRGGLRLEPAAMVARTRVPDQDADLERRALAALSKLCQQVDVPVPELRIREIEDPLCYTVRYPLEDPPREVLRADTDRFREWNSHTWESDRDYDDDRPIPSDHAVVLSRGLLEGLSDDQLSAVLAHEVAHLRNADLTLMNVLLLPVFWTESIVGFDDANDPEDYVLAAERTLRGALVRTTTLLGVGVFSRGREFAADAAAAELTGDPAALASALERLDGTTVERPSVDLRAVAVANVLPAVDERQTGLLASHPSTDRRVERLRGMVHEAEP